MLQVQEYKIPFITGCIQSFQARGRQILDVYFEEEYSQIVVSVVEEREAVEWVQFQTLAIYQGWQSEDINGMTFVSSFMDQSGSRVYVFVKETVQ